MITRRVFGAVMVGAAVLSLAGGASAQRKPSKPDESQGAKVSQTIGAAEEVTITYHRPGVKGRNVWTDKSANPKIGALVPRNGDPWPWRAGANEATTITFTADVQVEGKDLAAGTYGLFMIPTDKAWTIVFSKKAVQWGSFSYKKDEDALRVDVKAGEAPMEEWLMYGFDSPDAYSCVAYLHWEKVKIPFKIELKKKG